MGVVCAHLTTWIMCTLDSKKQYTIDFRQGLCWSFAKSLSPASRQQCANTPDHNFILSPTCLSAHWSPHVYLLLTQRRRRPRKLKTELVRRKVASAAPCTVLHRSSRYKVLFLYTQCLISGKMWNCSCNGCMHVHILVVCLHTDKIGKWIMKSPATLNKKIWRK